MKRMTFLSFAFASLAAGVAVAKAVMTDTVNLFTPQPAFASGPGIPDETTNYVQVGKDAFNSAINDTLGAKSKWPTADHPARSTETGLSARKGGIEETVLSASARSFDGGTTGSGCQARSMNDADYTRAGDSYERSGC